MELSWSDHILFFVIGVLLPAMTILGTQQQLQKIKFNTAIKIRLYWSNNVYQWLMTLAVLGVWWWNGRSLELLGFPWPIPLPGGIPLAVLLVFLIVYVLDTYFEIRSEQVRKQTTEEMRQSLSFLPQTAYEYLHFIPLALTAGICEEIIFRGFFLRYLQVFFGEGDATYTIAILVGAVLFAIVHAYQGWRSVIKIGGMAVMFGYIFVQTDSLWLLILVHALVDLIGGALGWTLMASREDDHDTEPDLF